ncbi:hypothetical protein BDR04DRAFT_1117436 [Suillus decipiens]|nr:hypothetical protein BDR04DRAFT_1117436 [Suillus decipiens]
MSDIPPPQSMLPPVAAHPTQNYTIMTLALAMPLYAMRLVLGSLTPEFAREPKLSSPGTYALSTPANFKSKEEAMPPLVVPNHMIDPALLPLPDSGDLDLTDAVTIVKAHGHALVAKTAGSCHQAKGLKGKDIKTLLDMVHQELPLGQHGWQAVHVRFCQWAKVNKWPEHKVSSLETKFKQHINEHAGTRDLDDMDFNGIEDDDNHSIVSDPIHDESDSAQQNCDEDHANCSLATVQLLTQGQQFRDLQASVETLQGKLFDLRSHLYDVEYEHDQAELCMEMIEMTGSTHYWHIWMPKCKNLHQE